MKNENKCSVCGKDLFDPEYKRDSRGESLYWLVDNTERKIFCGPEHAYKWYLEQNNLASSEVDS